MEFRPELLIARIRAGTGVPDLPVRIERIGTFTFAAQVATRYREGSVFLVGDAAHRTTPRGGTGMNTAIQDGLDLGWRMAWVVRGWADPDLLDRYESLRRPIGERNTARSASVEPRDNSLDYLDDLAGRIAHVWVCQGDRVVSTLDLVGDGLTLMTGPAASAWSQAGVDLDARVPVAVHGIDADAAAELGIGADGAVLVGPDAIPIASWQAFDESLLAEATNSIAGSAMVHSRLAAVGPSDR
jgi:putative polyketide hydroxylase